MTAALSTPDVVGVSSIPAEDVGLTSIAADASLSNDATSVSTANLTVHMETEHGFFIPRSNFADVPAILLQL